MTEKERLAICENIPGSTTENLFQPVRDMSKETAKHLLSQVTDRRVYPIGKLQESFAVYKCGVEFDGVNFRKQKVNAPIL